MKIERTERFETSEYKIQTPDNYLEESIQLPEYGKSFEIKEVKFSQKLRPI